MPHLSPPTLTHGEQKAILRATARNPRDHLIYSLALGTGLRLAEIVGLNVGDVYKAQEPRPPAPRDRQERQSRRRVPAGCAGGQVPEILAAQGHEARGTGAGGSALLLSEPDSHLAASRLVRLPDMADEGWFRPTVPLARLAAHGSHERLPAIARPVPGAEVRATCVAADDDRVHASERRGALAGCPRIDLLR